MAKGKITKLSVDRLKPGEHLTDTEIRGFMVRCTPSGTKTYGVKYRIGGRQRWLTVGLHGPLTPEQARAEARKALGQVAAGKDPQAEKEAARARLVTVSELADRYLKEHVATKNKPSTAKEVTRLIERVIKPSRLGTMAVAVVTSADVASFHTLLGKTPRQANHALAVLRKMFNLAERWQLRPIRSNPCTHITLYPENERDRVLSAEELQQLSKALSILQQTGKLSVHIAELFRLLALSGCRLGEALALRWEDIDFQNGTLRIRDAKAGPRMHMVGTLSIELIASIPRVDGSPWVFPSTNPTAHVTVYAAEKHWNKVREQAGIPDVRIHDLRHTVATFAAQSPGANAFAVRDLLGHKTLAMANRYVARANEKQRTLSEAVESTIGAAMKGSTAQVVELAKNAG